MSSKKGINNKLNRNKDFFNSIDNELNNDDDNDNDNNNDDDDDDDTYKKRYQRYEK